MTGKIMNFKLRLLFGGPGVGLFLMFRFQDGICARGTYRTRIALFSFKYFSTTVLTDNEVGVLLALTLMSL